MGKLTEEVFNRENLAWAAGVFEGEGTFASRTDIHKQRKDRAITMSIRMVDEDIIKRFHSIVGVGNVTGPSKPKNDNWKPLWTWQTGSFEGSQAVAAMLWNWLGSRRKERIKFMLNLYHSNKPKGPYIRNKETGRFGIQECV